jgi:hypothetical protein
MPWQDLLSPAQRVQVLALPTSLREYEEIYTLTPADLEQQEQPPLLRWRQGST